jgi:RNA-binding protein 26
LKEHFSSYGDLSNVELEDLEANESEGLKNCSACITFTARRSAERAYVNGKMLGRTRFEVYVADI